MQTDPIWMIWDVIFAEADRRKMSNKVLQSLLNLYCIRYNAAAKRKRIHLLYFAVSLLTEKYEVKKDGFKTPRTVNLRRIIDLNKIENYVSKYLSKGSKERRIVSCRHTGNSYSLSNIKNSFDLLQVELNNYFDYCYQILKKPIVKGDYWEIINIRAFEHLNEFLNVNLKDHLKKSINLEPSEEIRRNLIEDKLNYKFHFN